MAPACSHLHTHPPGLPDTSGPVPLVTLEESSEGTGGTQGHTLACKEGADGQGQRPRGEQAQSEGACSSVREQMNLASTAALLPTDKSWEAGTLGLLWGP